MVPSINRSKISRGAPSGLKKGAHTKVQLLRNTPATGPDQLQTQGWRSRWSAISCIHTLVKVPASPGRSSFLKTSKPRWLLFSCQSLIRYLPLQKGISTPILRLYPIRCPGRAETRVRSLPSPPNRPPAAAGKGRRGRRTRAPYPGPTSPGPWPHWSRACMMGSSRRPARPRWVHSVSAAISASRFSGIFSARSVISMGSASRL